MVGRPFGYCACSVVFLTLYFCYTAWFVDFFCTFQLLRVVQQNTREIAQLRHRALGCSCTGQFS